MYYDDFPYMNNSTQNIKTSSPSLPVLSSFHNNMFDIIIKSCNPTHQQQVSFESNKHGDNNNTSLAPYQISCTHQGPTYLQAYQVILASTRFKHQSSVKKVYKIKNL